MICFGLPEFCQLLILIDFGWLDFDCALEGVEKVSR